jgi:hypothetical protein
MTTKLARRKSSNLNNHSMKTNLINRARNCTKKIIKNMGNKIRKKYKNNCKTKTNSRKNNNNSLRRVRTNF